MKSIKPYTSKENKWQGLQSMNVNFWLLETNIKPYLNYPERPHTEQVRP